jgi:hypothetical protein
MQILRRWRDPLFIAGILLLILGTRIFIGIRFVAAVPQGDDAYTLAWLQGWSQGVHNWGFIFQRHNGHPMELYYLANLGQFLLNGYWDPRLDFLVYVFIHTIYAAVVIATFGHLLAPRDRVWILFFILFLFAIPFAGYRIGWGLEWPDTAMMALALGGIHVSVYRGQTWSGATFTILLAALASVNLAAGCLCGFAIAALTLFRAALARRITSQDIAIAAGCLIVFLIQYLTLDKSSRAGLVEGVNALLKALAWPVVFIPGIGLLTIVPLAALVLGQIVSPAFRRNNVAFLTGAGALIFLISVATGAFRGDNNIQGQPSGRYTDIFIMVPLICITALCVLYRESSGRERVGWGIFTYCWLCLQIFGFSIHIFYRVIPFISGDSGEWSEGQKQVLFRSISQDLPHAKSLETINDSNLSLFPSMMKAAKGETVMPAMTIPMITGFPLLPGSQGNYVPGGYHSSYRPRPAQVYVGSFDLSNPPPAEMWFVSGPFKPQAPYLTFDFLVEKRARFTNYSLPNLQVTLVDDTAGTREELLPKLAHQFPFLFRDWEWVYARVIPGHEYRIASQAKPVNFDQWIAFGEPFESGRLTPLLVGLSQSGKWICMLGLGFLAASLGIGFLERELAKPSR